ncbi:MAG: peptidoglycan DD-metalloendopeptidase family protein [Elusimicrobia bacterium]|nr:peptidoglycan DD-metalloendopeptidase family protein [Elusimicrobiota bacterium]
MPFVAGGTGRSISAVVFLLGASLGVLAESALLLRAHTQAVEAWLREDLRVIVFMKDGVGPARRAVAEEKLRALEGVGAARLVPSDESLGEFAAGDPDLARSAAFLGTSPLPDAVEIRLSDEGLRRLPSWLREAESIPEIGDIVYKPLEIHAIMQVQLYRKLLTLALALACGLWVLALAVRVAAGAAASRLRAPGAVRGAVSAALGTAFGIGAVLLLVYPLRHRDAVRAWPSAAEQALLLAAGAAAGWILFPAAFGRRSAEKPPVEPAKARVWAALLCIAGLLGVSSAWAANPDPQRKQRDLKKIQEQIEHKREEAQQYQRLQRQVRKDITTLLDRRQRSQRQLIELKDRREEALRRASELSEKLGALRSAHGSGRRLLAEQNRAYALALVWGEPLHGSSELWRQELRRSAIRARLRLLGGLKSAESRAAAQRERVRTEARSLETKTTRAAAQMREHETLYQQKQEIFRETSQKVAQTLQEIRELEESARALASLLGDLERQRRDGRKPGEYPAVARHSLPWPSEGRVLSRFGKTHVPKLNTWTIHNGIRIATEADAPVFSVASGRVIFSGPFRSYGNVLIVDHDAGFYGIYGQLGRMLKGKGERVAPMSEIATAGPAGKEGVLYFEIRQGQEPLDPLILLEPR